jgi:transglutaminase superfamily protein
MMGQAMVTPPTDAGKAAFRRRLPISRKLGLGAEIVGTYVRARWLLRRTELPDALAVLRGDRPLAVPTDGDRLLTGIRLGRSIGRTLGVLPADSRCLIRSLVLTSLLARRGIGSVLVIGVRSQPDFKAHAWVECSGVPLLDPGEADRGRLVEL